MMSMPGDTNPDAMPDNSAVVILGMHRSGTSALSRSLSFFGFQQPSDATGHWESDAVMRLNAAILRRLSAKWHYPGPFLAPGMTLAETRDWLAGALADRHRSEAVAELRRVYGSAQSIVLKEPRISTLWRLWDEALRECGFSARHVF